MAGHPYWYVVDYRENVRAALEALREREFLAGRYNPVVRLPMEQGGAGMSARHANIEEALAAAGEEGTRSILDIDDVGDEPEHGTASRLLDEELQSYFGTTMPTVDEVKECDSLWQDIARGTARFVIAFKDGAPQSIVFLGYSYD